MVEVMGCWWCCHRNALWDWGFCLCLSVCFLVIFNFMNILYAWIQNSTYSRDKKTKSNIPCSHFPTHWKILSLPFILVLATLLFSDKNKSNLKNHNKIGMKMYNRVHKCPIMCVSDGKRFSLVWDSGRSLLSVSLTYALDNQEVTESVQDAQTCAPSLHIIHAPPALPTSRPTPCSMADCKKGWFHRE